MTEGKGSMGRSLGRREFLSGAGLAGVGAAVSLSTLEGCSVDVRTKAPAPPAVAQPPAALAFQVAPVRARTDRITSITVCTRPFRAQGPRLDVERMGSKTVVHNYGHGGSGWSLSWGSSTIAAENALATGERNIAVIGCGALGLTSALLLQRAGAHVTIYAKDMPPNVRSSLASGVWSPDSRICLQDSATPAFKQLWERMARQSFRTYQTLLGLPGDPVEFIDNYFVSNPAAASNPAAPSGPAVPNSAVSSPAVLNPAPPTGPATEEQRPPFADLQGELIRDLIPQTDRFAPGTHPFGERSVRRTSFMMFNISAYARMLVSDFLAGGGRIEVREFHTPADFAQLREKTLVNATGYGARALLGDQSITPVRGQLAHLIPQPEIHYGLYYKRVSFVPRRDGLVLQFVGDSDYFGFNDDSTVPDRAEAELAVNTIAELFRSDRPNPSGGSS
jgi:glycine/D-amino acid oxidase-like deaminating enzyme